MDVFQAVSPENIKFAIYYSLLNCVSPSKIES